MRKLHRSLVLFTLVGAAVLTAIVSPSTQPPARADVQNFSYLSWHVDTHIETNPENHATATVTETLVAVFPDSNQNRGIVRSMQLTSFGAHTAPENIRVTDEHGNDIPFAVEDEDAYRVILIGDDNYVHGEQHYVLNYDLTDVILPAAEISGNPDGPDTDEWYWDIIPLEREQAIQAASATVTFSPELAPLLTGASGCYTGAAGSHEQCDISLTESPNVSSGTATLTVQPIPLDPGTGITLAVGLAAGSVTQPDVRLPDPLLDLGPIVIGSVSTAFGVLATTLILRFRSRRGTHRGTVIAQYEMPSNLPPILAAEIFRKRKSHHTAQLVHLAVNGVLQFEADQSGAKNAPPALRLSDRSACADPLDEQTVNALFGTAPNGTLRTIPKNDEAFATQMRALSSAAATAATERGLIESVRVRSAALCGAVALGAAAAAILLLMVGSDRDAPSTLGWSLVLLAAGIACGFFGIVKHRVHTPAGAADREYLLGVNEFIRVAEAERLRVLQSPTGAERITVGSAESIRV